MPPALPPANYVDADGRPVRLGALLGRGGEGSVYTLDGARAGHVAKIYHEPLPAAKQDKLARMARMVSPDLLKITTWPVATLHLAYRGPVQGILMPKLVGYEDIHVLYGPAHRKREFPRADWGFLVQAARNTAAALATLHMSGVVVGDINPGNVVVAQQAVVKLIDSDSFQVALDGQVFRCEVGVAHFTPPELQGLSFAQVTRTPNHDHFGLAVLTFLLLFMGRHPFAGRIGDGQRDLSLEQAISSLRFAYSSFGLAHHVLPPPNTPPLRVVPPSMAAMFEQAFSAEGMAGGRPTAAEWVAALDDLRRRLVVCSQSSMHRYYADLPACPWCDLELRSGVVFFVEPDQPDEQARIEALWQAIAAIAPPAAPPLPAASPAVTGAPLPTDAVGDGSLTAERQRRQAALRAAQAAWVQFEQRWPAETSPARFTMLQQELAAAYARYGEAVQRYRQDLRRLHQAQRREQLGGYLDDHDLEVALVPGLTPTLVAVFASYGIETAADITPERLRATPGVTDRLYQDLSAWRVQVEQAFLFDVPDRPTSAQELAAQTRYEHELAALTRQFMDGKRTLEQMAAELEERHRRLAAEAQQLAHAQAQAAADLAVVDQALPPAAARNAGLPPAITMSVVQRTLRVVASYGALLLVLFFLLGQCDSDRASQRQASPASNTPAVNATRLFPLLPPANIPKPTPTPVSPTAIRCAKTRVVEDYGMTPGAMWSPETLGDAEAARRATMTEVTPLYKYGGGGALCRLQRRDVVTVIGRHPVQASYLVRTALGDIGWIWMNSAELEHPLVTMPVVEP